MGNLLENLKKYFKDTSAEQIKKDWDAAAKYDEVDSPLVDDYMEDLNFQLGQMAGEYVVATQLPTLSTDRIHTNCIIEVDQKLYDIWHEKEEKWYNTTNEQLRTKIFYENLKWYKENIEDVYLEDEIHVRVSRVEPTDLKQFVKGFEVALWNSDLSRYKYSEFILNKKWGDTFIKLKREG